MTSGRGCCRKKRKQGFKEQTMKKINENGRILPRMVSAKEAGEMKAAGIAVKDILDVGMVFMISPEDAGLTAEDLGIPKDLFDFAKIRIDEEALRETDTSIDELYAAAKKSYWESAGVEAAHAVKLSTVLKKLSDECGEPLPEGMTEEGHDLYIAPYCVENGAVILAEPDVFKQIADVLQSDLYVLPLSRHEVIIIPAEGKDEPVNAGELQDVVRFVNTTLMQEDILSDSVYRFTRETGQLTVMVQG